MAITCCHGCVAPERHIGCHAKCKKYLEQRLALDIENAKIKQIKQLEQASIESVMHAVIKQARKKNKKRLR